LALNEALARTMGTVGEINGYLERTAPWNQVKMGRTDRVATILYYAVEALRLTSILLQPVLPERMAKLWHRLGWQPPAPLQDGLSWGELLPGTQVVSGPPLFPRNVGAAN
jgi:methionyl-tRNA synthetase